MLPASVKLQHLTKGAAKDPTTTYQPVLAGRRYFHHGVYLPNTVAVVQQTTVEINYDPFIINQDPDHQLIHPVPFCRVVCPLVITSAG
ncbi:MAG: hypothetical protein ACFFD4_16985 [Candidatus Odinarchaeota archaeon]